MSSRVRTEDDPHAGDPHERETYGSAEVEGESVASPWLGSATGEGDVSGTESGGRAGVGGDAVDTVPVGRWVDECRGTESGTARQAHASATELTGRTDPEAPGTPAYAPEAGEYQEWPMAAGAVESAEPAQVFRAGDARDGTGPGEAGMATVGEGAERATYVPDAPAESQQGAEAAWDDGLIARRADPTGNGHGSGTEAGAAARTARVAHRHDEGRGSGHRAGRADQEAACDVAEVQTHDVDDGPAPTATVSSVGAEHAVSDQDHSAVSGPNEEPAAAAVSVGTAGTAATAQPRTGVAPGAGHRSGDTGGPVGLRDQGLLRRLGALRELIGLSRTRVDGQVLAEAGHVLDEAGARGRLSAEYTTVAIAGATGSGKSSLFNAMANRALSEVGIQRPTTARPVGCTWEAEREGGADGLLDRLEVAPVDRRRVRDAELHGLVLIDLPDHDSMAEGHREHVDRLLELVDAVVWVVDPEKYADAVLHERYLRPLAGYAEVTFVVLNQTDRLPGEATDAVLDDLRRLLDDDGMAVGEHGEAGAKVLATSALTGEGIGELRAELGAFVATGAAPTRRLLADLDGAAERLRPAYADPHLSERTGLTDEAREEFEDRLASAVGATAAGQAAERAWLRHAERSCGTPWAQLVRWRDMRRPNHSQRLLPLRQGGHVGALPWHASVPQAAGGSAATSGSDPAQPSVARPVLAQAVRELAVRAVTGLPDAWRRTVRDAAWRGAEGLPEALDAVVSEAAQPGADDRRRPARMHRPPWWTAATAGQGLLLALQVLGVVWLVGAAFGAYDGPLWLPVLLVLGGGCCGPLLAWGCRAAARGPARGYGQDEERRLRRLAVSCGRSRVLEPVAAELLRYHEVREQYVIAAGDTERG